MGQKSLSDSDDANLALGGNANDVGIGGSNGVKAEGTMRVGDELGKR